MSDTKVPTPEQIAELRAAIAAATQGPMSMWGGRGWPKGWDAVPDAEIVWPIAQATASTDGGYVAAALSHEDQRLLWLLWNAAPALLDAAERCARLSEAIPFTVKGFAGELPAIDILENVATQLTTATRERDEMAKERLEALKLAHSLTLETQTMPEAVTELVRLAHKARGERDAAIARAEAAEKAERARIVAWLRGLNVFHGDVPRRIAYCIERGDHAKGGG